MEMSSVGCAGRGLFVSNNKEILLMSNYTNHKKQAREEGRKDASRFWLRSLVVSLFSEAGRRKGRRSQGWN